MLTNQERMDFKEKQRKEYNYVKEEFTDKKIRAFLMYHQLLFSEAEFNILNHTNQKIWKFTITHYVVPEVVVQDWSHKEEVMPFYSMMSASKEIIEHIKEIEKSVKLPEYGKYLRSKADTVEYAVWREVDAKSELTRTYKDMLTFNSRPGVRVGDYFYEWVDEEKGTMQGTLLGKRQRRYVDSFRYIKTLMMQYPKYQGSEELFEGLKNQFIQPKEKSHV